MLICHHCHKMLDVPDNVTGRVVCPHCRADIDPATARAIAGTPFENQNSERANSQHPAPADPDSSLTEWSTVARSTSMAEIGYLAHRLESIGLEVRVEQHDSFSAVDGSWTALFLLQVPVEEAERAAYSIQEQLTRDESDSVEEAIPANELMPDALHDKTDLPVFWRPVAMIVFAGAALLFVGHRIRHLRGPEPDPPRPSSLLRALEQIEQPFVSQPSPNDSRRYRITFNRDQRRWHLETDLDGDGAYDLHQIFQ